MISFNNKIWFSETFLICGWDLAEWLERLTANAVVATVLGSQWNLRGGRLSSVIVHKKKNIRKNPPLKKHFIANLVSHITGRKTVPLSAIIAILAFKPCFHFVVQESWRRRMWACRCGCTWPWTTRTSPPGWRSKTSRMLWVASLQPRRLHTAKTKYRDFETNILRKGISGSQSQFPHSCVCEWFVYSHDRSAYSAGGNM